MCSRPGREYQPASRNKIPVEDLSKATDLDGALDGRTGKAVVLTLAELALDSDIGAEAASVKADDLDPV
jgi:hypothetical protein